MIRSVFLIALPVLACTNSAEPPPRTDPYGDPLPPGAIARLGTTRFRQGFITYCVAFSPDSKALAAGASGRGLCLWDTATGRELRDYQQPSQILSVAISPDGKLLASSSGRPTVLLDVATGQTVAELQGVMGVVWCYAFSPHSRVLAGAERDGAVRLWDTVTGQELRELPHQTGAWWVVYSPDGKALASAGRDKLVHLWDAATGKELHRLAGHQEEVQCVAFSPDGKLLASASQEPIVRFWDPATGKELRTLQSNHGKVYCVAFSPDGKTLASANDDGTIQLWDTATWQARRCWQAHGLRVTQVAFSPDGKLLASASPWECGPCLWNAATGERVSPDAGHHTPVEFLAFAADGRSIISAGRVDSRLQQWDCKTARARRYLDWPNLGWTRVAMSPEGRTVARLTGRDLSLEVWDTGSGQARWTTKNIGAGGRGYAVRILALSPDGRQVAVSDRDDVIHIFDAQNGKVLRQLPKLPAEITHLRYSPDGRILAAGLRLVGGVQKPGQSGLVLWDLMASQPLPAPHTEDVYDIAFSPDGRLLAVGGGFDVPVRLWNLATGKELSMPSAFRGTLVFSLDGRLLAGGGNDFDRHVYVCEVASRQLVFEFTGHVTGPMTAAFAPDGRTLATGGSDSQIFLWDLTSRMPDGKWTTVDRDPQQLEGLWSSLAADAQKASPAIWELAASPGQTVPFLKQRLRPVATIPAERIAHWIADLDSDRFATRQQATTELEKAAEQIVAKLRKALEGAPSLEFRRRVETLLAQAETGVPSADRLRTLRAIAVLEQIGTEDARQVLKLLGEGAAEAAETREAKAALARLASR